MSEQETFYFIGFIFHSHVSILFVVTKATVSMLAFEKLSLVMVHKCKMRDRHSSQKTTFSSCLLFLSHDSCIVTGDTRGHVNFYDENMLLLTWFTQLNLDPIVSISFSKEFEREYLEDGTLDTKPLLGR